MPKGQRTSDCNDCGAKWHGAQFKGVSLCPLHAAASSMLKSLQMAEKFYREELENIGPCEHDVNICVCGITSELHDIQATINEAQGAQP